MVLNAKKFQMPVLLLASCLVIVGSVAGWARIPGAAGRWTEGVQWLLGQQVPNNAVPTPASGHSGLALRYTIPQANDFPDGESVVGTARTVILESGHQAAFWDLDAALSVTKQASSGLAQAGAPLTYTIRITNTGSVTLNATITDTLPDHVSPTGVLNWTAAITAPGGIWTQQVVVNVEAGYTGPLTNKVQVTTEQGAMGTASVTVCTNHCLIYLPLVLKNYPPPWITVTVNGYQASGQVWPSSYCNDGYKVALYAKVDIWYVQPVKAEPGRNVQIESDCTWESPINPWIQVAAHLVPANYRHPDEIRAPFCPPPPLDPATNPNVLAADCYPDTYP